MTSGEVRKSVRRELLPQRLKPLVHDIVASPIVQQGGQVVAARVLFPSGGGWGSLVQQRDKVDGLVACIPGMDMLVSSLTVIPKYVKKGDNVPAMGLWAVQDPSKDPNQLLRNLRLSLPNADIRQVQTTSPVDAADDANKMLCCILKDYNSPWLLDKLAENGTPLAVQDVIRCYPGKYRRIFDSAIPKLASLGILMKRIDNILRGPLQNQLC